MEDRATCAWCKKDFMRGETVQFEANAFGGRSFYHPECLRAKLKAKGPEV